MEQKLIYNYSYGTEDILAADIKIYKQKNNKYELIAEFTLFDEISLPTIKTTYKILTFEKNKNCDEEGLIIITYKIKILCVSNPRPEKLFIIN